MGETGPSSCNERQRHTCCVLYRVPRHTDIGRFHNLGQRAPVRVRRPPSRVILETDADCDCRKSFSSTTIFRGGRGAQIQRQAQNKKGSHVHYGEGLDESDRNYLCCA